MRSVKQKVSIVTAIWRVIKLLWHFSLGAGRLFLFGKHYDDLKKEQLLRCWSYKLLKILDIRLVVEGQAPPQLQNTLLVANHISWLDILIIFTVIKPRFVAKKEIAEWPIIGWLTKLGDTVFIERGNKRHIVQVNKQLANALASGSCIAVFPEGATSLGTTVNHFKSSLFEPIYCSKGQVLPVALQYLDSSGAITTRPSFAGKISLLRSVWNVLTCYKLTIKVIFNDVLDSQAFSERAQLALAAQQAIGYYWSINHESTN